MSESPDPPSDLGPDAPLDPKLRAVILLLIALLLLLLISVVLPDAIDTSGDMLSLVP